MGTPLEARAKALMEQMAGRPLPAWGTFASSLVVHRLGRGDPLPGHQQPIIFYVVSGLVKTFLPGQRNFVVRFVQPRQLVLSGSSDDIAMLLNVNLSQVDLRGQSGPPMKTPSGRLKSVALEETEVIGYPAHILAQLASVHVPWAALLTSGALMFSQFYAQRWMDMVTLSVEERYVKFVRENPVLVQKLTQKSIAEYLQVTPVALSRIIGRLRAKQAEGAHDDPSAEPSELNP